MKINQSIKYLEFKKLKLSILTLFLYLLPKKIYYKLENWVEKIKTPIYIRFILTFIYSLIVFTCYIILLKKLPTILTGDALLVYTLGIIIFTVLIAIKLIKVEFFDYLAHDHFFNMLGKNQSTYIILKIKHVYKGMLFSFFIPFTLPILFHYLIYLNNYFIIIIYPLIFLFIYQAINIFGVIFWYLYALVKRIFILKMLFTIFRFMIYIGALMQFMIIITYFITTYQGDVVIDMTAKQIVLFNLILSGILLLINGILFLLRKLPNKIIHNSYKTIIYAEGNTIKAEKNTNNNLFHKFLALGMINLDNKEKAIYQKDLKYLLRKENNIAYIIGISITLIFYILLSSFGSNPISGELTKYNESFNDVFIILNIYLACTLGYFSLMHRKITSYSAEGTNHIIYKQLKLNYYQVFRAKFFLNRYLVILPIIPFFVISCFKINSFNSLLLYIILFLYAWGIINVIIRAIMVEDFNNPRFNGVYTDYLKNKSSLLNDFYWLFLLYAFFAIPYTTKFFLKLIPLWSLIIIYLLIIYLIYFILIKKCLKIKKATEITYGGLYVKSQ